MQVHYHDLPMAEELDEASLDAWRAFLTAHAHVTRRISRELRDRVTGEIKVPQDYSEVGVLMIAATLITLLVPLVTVAGVRLLRLRTA